MSEPTSGRRLTEQRLEQSALELMSENGVLAGLNLREVAMRIGVNRGLVYHYFGSRRDLLRSALRSAGRDLRARMLRQREGRTFRTRTIADLESSVGDTENYFQLLALLVIDGDPEVRVLPVLEETRELLTAEAARGELPADTDLAAIDVITTSLISAYAIFRDRYAAELGIPVDELDTRVTATLDRILRTFESGSRA